MRRLLVVIFVIYSKVLMAEENAIDTLKPLIFSAYLEPYYGYDFDKPQHNSKPSFLYSYTSHNRVNVNLGFAKASVNKTNCRANMAFAFGTYMRNNLADEPAILKNILELNIGWKLPNRNIWIDAGVFPSHIGFESAIGKDNFTLSRSIMAENSPYYETGLKTSFQSKNQKINFSLLVLNGWQKIYRTNKSNHPAFGHQLQYQVDKRVLVNSSSFVGLASRDTSMVMRYFHNAYCIYEASDKWQFIFSFDIGAQEKISNRNLYDIWHTMVFVSRYRVNTNNSISGRFEYYTDRNQVLVNYNLPTVFSTTGCSLNYDWSLSKHILWRNECRYFFSLRNFAAITAFSFSF